MDLLHKEITEKIIKAFYKVYNTLGYGFSEKVYENAMTIELRKMGLNINVNTLFLYFMKVKLLDRILPTLL